MILQQKQQQQSNASGGGRKVVGVGNYKFTGRRLGKGNFAKVEEAVHTLLNVKVAVKIMDVSAIKEEYVIRNLYREAKIMSQLSHPCIAALFQTMQHGNLYYLVTELVGGGDLCNFIKGQRNGRLEENCTRTFARQLISAISHMHNLGIVHRDLKMENVLLNMTNDKIKIVDFGLSNIYSSNNPLRTHCGSPEYAAPELFVEGRQYGPEVDLWSLGVILYGMMVGQLPFVSTTRDGALTTQQQRRKRLLEQINKGLSTPHRKALALFSLEFKSMMAKLLVAESSKRITVTELIYHPWVTEKGRKAIRTNPLKKLDECSRATILQEIAVRTSKLVPTIEDAIRNDPQGDMAGMYNLIAHAKMQSSSDAISVPTRNLTPHYITPRPKAAHETGDHKLHRSKRQTLLKSAPVQRTHRQSVQIDTTPRTCGTRRNVDKTNRNYGIDLKPLRRNFTQEAMRPAKVVDAERPSRTPRSERKDCVVGDFIEQISKSPQQLCSSPAGDCKRTVKCSHHEVVSFDLSGPAYNTRSKHCVQDETMKLAARKRSQSVNVENQTGALSLHRARPLTSDLVHHPADKSTKRKSMLPVMKSKQASASSRHTTRHPLSAGERHVEAADDARKASISPVAACTGPRPDYSSDRIARSIAGFLAKNITSPLEPVGRLKQKRLK